MSVTVFVNVLAGSSGKRLGEACLPVRCWHAGQTQTYRADRTEPAGCDGVVCTMDSGEPDKTGVTVQRCDLHKHTRH